MEEEMRINTLAAISCFFTFGFFVGMAVPENTSYANAPDYLDIRTVIDFNATEAGLMLYTEDGFGWYWER